MRNYFNRLAVVLFLCFCLPAVTETERKHRKFENAETNVPDGAKIEVLRPGAGTSQKARKGSDASLIQSAEEDSSVESGSSQTGNSTTANATSRGTRKRGGSSPIGMEKITSANCEFQHPIETFVQISSASSAQSSRLGGVYFLSDLREVSQVFYLDEAMQWPKQISFFADGVVYFRVSPDGEKIILATHQGGNEQYNLFLFTPRDKKTVPIVADPEERVETVAWEPGSRWFAYTSNKRNKVDFDLYQFDLATGRSSLLQELNGMNEVTDISPNGNFIAFGNYRSITDSDVRVYDRAQKRVTEITQSKGEGSNSQGRFAANSQEILYLSDAQTETAQLYRSRLAEPRPLKVLTKEAFEIERFELNRNRDQLIYFVNESGYSRLAGHTLDRSGMPIRQLSLPQFEKLIIRDLSFSQTRTGTSFFYTATSATQSSDVWFYQEGQRRQWTGSTHGLIDPACFSKAEMVEFETFDQRKIPGFLYLPSKFTGPKHAIPFILYLHGGPEAQFRPFFSRTFQYFLERGYGIFAPNVRGSSGYGKTYVSLDNYKKRMDSVQDAVEAAKWLIKEGYTTPAMLAINGGSYGGFMVLRTIQVAPELFAAASESVGISDFVTFLQNTKPYRRKLREVEYGPLSDEEFLRSVSPMTYLDRIRTPLLIFHGANDPRVPVGEAEQITKALKKRKVPVDLKIFADEGHGNAKLRNVMDQARKMAHFFDTHLKVSP